jgi:CRISPR-associated protein Cas1
MWLEKQVAAWADPEQRIEVAKRLYRMRFPTDPGAASIERLRGLEGASIREACRRLSKKHGISFRRSYKRTDWDAADPVNRALSAANHLLYGIAQTALVAVGSHPGPGFIHTGTNRAFVFDIADLHKLEIAAPAAFACHDADNPEAAVRGKLRRKVSNLRLLSRLVPDIQHCLDPSQARKHLPLKSFSSFGSNGSCHQRASRR